MPYLPTGAGLGVAGTLGVGDGILGAGVEAGAGAGIGTGAGLVTVGSGARTVRTCLPICAISLILSLLEKTGRNA
jgi:hypothetical protein